MQLRPSVRLYTFALVTVTFLAAAPAATAQSQPQAQPQPQAQFQPKSVGDSSIGESYHVEGAVGFWFPSADMQIASSSLGQAATLIDFRNDLGLQDSRFSELHLTVRPAQRHKFRLQFIPISYTQQATLKRNIVFNGQNYTINLPVNSSLDWKAWRFGYEFDFISRDRGFGGLVIDFKYTDVQASLSSPIRSDFAHAQAPIPAIGGIFRVYVVPNVSITGEITGFSLPDTLFKDTSGHYVDVDFYGTVNFTNNVGAQIGYRSFDVGYVASRDTGNFVLKGFYLGIVARY